MKTLTLSNFKGGTGKSAVAVQLAYHAHLKRGLRVMVIDTDHQCNTTRILTTGAIARVSETLVSQIFIEGALDVEQAPFILLPGDNTALLKMERQSDLHNAYATNLKAFLASIDADFDLAVIDCNPTPDIRMLSALVCSDFVLSPINLTQESIHGISDFLNHPGIGIRKIQATLNPTLEFLGVLPNAVEKTPFQQQNLAALVQHYSSLLIPLDDGFAAIKKSTGMPEAQASGLPIWQGQKTSSRDAYRQAKPTFNKIIDLMGMQP